MLRLIASPPLGYLGVKLAHLPPAQKAWPSAAVFHCQAGSGRSGEDHPAVRRLKRYIRACGAHRNYKKLLGSCRSRKERLSVLRAELEALGMKGEAGCALGSAERDLAAGEGGS